MDGFFQSWEPVIIALIIIAGAIIIGFLLDFILVRILNRQPRLTSNFLYKSLLNNARRSVKYLIILIIINIAMPAAHLSTGTLYIFNSVFRSLFIIAVSWVVISLMAVGEDVILSRYDINVKDNLQARKIRTQTQTIRRILAVIIIILTIALILLGFDSLRQIGTGILASAGLASLVIGLAAQKIFGNFLAGIQIAFSQPIRVEDVVIVENEWGTIEEITLTYVVVKIWDLRRLIVPISYFIENPFENWTRTTADILGTVFIYTDYTVPVGEVREELNRVLKASDKWDGKVAGLQVTDTNERVMELRALMSASDSSRSWDLRCEVREKLLEFVRNKYPDALPKTRAELKKIEHR
ncbi:MAG TPA: mechanosensitive ion channel domain-containing protein [Dehalococcoidales bacterium]|nr:mechanosensitive ion channel domain-containing protein [Dehalococcoidales bacterium]